MNHGRFDVWKTIRLGTHESGEDLFTTLINKDFKVCRLAELELIRANPLVFPVSEHERSIDLVRVTPQEMGFTHMVTNHYKLCQRAEEFGLSWCPREVGPQLCLQYPDQPRDEELHIASFPFNNLRVAGMSLYGRLLFVVKTSELDVAAIPASYWGGGVNFYRLDTEFIFTPQE